MTNHLSEMKILIVDDSDYSRQQIKSMLIQAGLKVIGEASNGEEAIRLTKERKPHLVITDIVMPEMSGIALTERICTTINNVAVIVVSSLGQEQIVIEAIAAGASDFIQKPIRPQQLIESVTKVLTSLNRE